VTEMRKFAKHRAWMPLKTCALRRTKFGSNIFFFWEFSGASV